MDKNQKPKILIVDDERPNLRILFHALINEYEVVAADSGELCIEKALYEKPDVILLDILMPNMDGYEVMNKLKESKATHDIPIIFITGLTSTHDEVKGLFMGAVDYITKPFNIEIVKARVRTHVKIVRQMRIIEELGMMDALTNIANRRKFDQQLSIEWVRSIREKSPLSLLMIDVDNFKSYNDSYGHPAGDGLLQILTKTITSAINRATDLEARIGGEEFAVLLPSTDINGALIVAETIRSSIESLNIPSGINPTLPVTISLGVISAVPDTKSLVEEFIKACDKNLYIAKNTGKNKVSSVIGKYISSEHE